jgi:ubiquinone/menaquinone biosynthesis C-methylase UbiE
MALTEKEKATIGFYDREAKSWDAQHPVRLYWGEMETFFKNLPNNSRVLEIGCGTARDAQDYLLRNYRYVGTDISESFINEGSKLNPGKDFVLQSAYEMSFASDCFAGFWVAATLLHIPKDRINEVLNSICRVVQNEGVGFISLKQGVGEKEDEEGRWFSYYSQNEFTEILMNNNFSVVEPSVQTSGKTTWLKYIVRVQK